MYWTDCLRCGFGCVGAANAYGIYDATQRLDGWFEVVLNNWTTRSPDIAFLDIGIPREWKSIESCARRSLKFGRYWWKCGIRTEATHELISEQKRSMRRVVVCYLSCGTYEPPEKKRCGWKNCGKQLDPYVSTVPLGVRRGP